MLAAKSHEALVRLLTDFPDHSAPQDREFEKGFKLADIRLVAGFLTLVRQTPLRQALPYTFAALRLTGLEVEVFADYTPTFTNIRANKCFDHSQRRKHLEKFLLARLSRQSEHESLIKDVLLHEITTQHLLDMPTRTFSKSMTRHSPLDSQTCLTLNGHIISHAMEYQPLQFIQICGNNAEKAVLANASNIIEQIDALERRKRILIWWRPAEPSQQHLDVFELDSQSNYLLHMVDDTKNVGEILQIVSRQLDSNITEQDLLVFYEDCMKNGLVTPALKIKRNGETDENRIH